MFKDAKAGDKVWDFHLGWGEISAVVEDIYYPVHVCFPTREEDEAYTFDGKRFTEDKHPSLFWDEVKFEVPEKPVPKYYAAYFHKGHWAISNQKHESIQHFRACTHSNCPAHLLTGQDDD